MNGFRVLLLAMLIALAGYTAVVGFNHGWDLLPVFFGDIRTMSWPGQFNLDFSFMLTLSASWVAWRHRFSATGFALAVMAFFGGAMFLTAYLLFVTRNAPLDVTRVLLGDHAGSRQPSAVR